MNAQHNIWVVGGDRRQTELARLLAEDGHTVFTYALGDTVFAPAARADTLEEIACADWVVFPLPVSSGDDLLHAPLTPEQHTLAHIFAHLSPRQFLCGGRIAPAVQSLALAHGLSLHDYYAREELAVANAVPTAEGAIQLAMEHLPITIHGARVLVTGFGRVGRITAQRFSALGAKVSVAARRPDQLAWAQAMGLDSFPLRDLTSRLHQFDVVINTVPAPILGARELAVMPETCPILELASRPGGVDETAAAALGRTVIRAPALPGRVAPVTAAAAIKQTLSHMWNERMDHGT